MLSTRALQCVVVVASLMVVCALSSDVSTAGVSSPSGGAQLPMGSSMSVEAITAATTMDTTSTSTTTIPQQQQSSSSSSPHNSTTAEGPGSVSGQEATTTTTTSSTIHSSASEGGDTHHSGGEEEGGEGGEVSEAELAAQELAASYIDLTFFNSDRMMVAYFFCVLISCVLSIVDIREHAM